MVGKAGTLLIPSGPSHNPGRKHLHIVCTDPCQYGLQLIVSVTSWTNDLCDGSCILDVGDHDWIIHKSWVMYRKTKTESADTLINGLRLGLFSAEACMAGPVFERVCAGILASPHTPRAMKKYYRHQLAF